MNPRITELISEIRRLEKELEETLNTHTIRFRYEFVGAKVNFEESVSAAHKRLKVGTLRWLLASRPLNVLSAPVIYAMIVPFLFLDLAVSLYQHICFPLYGIPKLNRKQYIAFDRHHLSYLNVIEQFNCLYCSYINGLIAYVREIVARTEQYWCPIKHAKKLLAPHRRYAHFADFGDPDDLAAHSERMREALKRDFDDEP